MNILFVCTANKDRSKTAQEIFRKEKPWHEYKSCGTDKGHTASLGTTWITKSLCEWADMIICMESKHKIQVLSICGKSFEKKIRIIHLEDAYSYMSRELIEQLREKLNFL